MQVWRSPALQAASLGSTARGDGCKQHPARKLRIGFFGYFGSGNSGNDGSLETVLRRVRAAYPDAELLCICAEPAEIGPRLGVDCARINWKPRSKALLIIDRWLRNIPREIGTLVQGIGQFRRIDALVIPGTGILDDFCTGPKGMPYWLFRCALLARLTGTRVGFVSIGAGPIHHPLSRWLMKSAARLAAYRSYRDRYSLEYMRGIGLDVSRDHVFPDVAFALQEPTDVRRPSPAGGRVTVGVGVMYYNGWQWNPAGEAIYEDYLRKMTRFVEWLLHEGYTVRIISGDRVDRPTLEYFKGVLSRSSPRSSQTCDAPPETLHDVMREIAETDVVVATRYHNVVCALKLGRPTLSIGYAAKNDELMTDMGLEEFCQHIERLDCDRLIAQFRSLINGRKTYEARIRQTIARFRMSLEQQFELVFEDCFSPRSR
jgi:polysaccharide pyruvyl transferase WcaK-like protein